MKWIIDERMTELSNCTGNIPQAIKDVGSEVFLSGYNNSELDRDYGSWTEKECVSLYGSHGFIRGNKTPFIPGAYGFSENTSCNRYYSFLENDWMLNKDFIFLPFSAIMNRIDKVFDLFGGSFFIRPNSGFKTFTGQVLSPENAAHEINSLNQLSSVMPETICLLAPANRDIQGEFRFVIAANEVVDGSCYRWENKVDARHDWDNDCLRLAKEVSRHHWQPDLVYTCDVALTPDGPKIIELNSFCCAGLYATDKKRVFGRVSEVAELDFKGFYD